MGRPPHKKRLVAIVLATPITAAAIAACGSAAATTTAASSTATSPSATNVTSNSSTSAKSSFVACLAQHGITAPAGAGKAPSGSTAGGGNAAALHSRSGTSRQLTAFKDCRTSSPSGFGATGATGNAAAGGASASAAGGGSNARSGPAAGGSIGKVTSKSSTGLTLSTKGGQKVTVKLAGSTKYENRAGSVSASAITKGSTVLALGTTDSTTITATQVIVEPASIENGTASSKIVTFKRGTQSESKEIGQIPSNYSEGSGTITSGTTANKAAIAALSAYPGGIVDRVVKISSTVYEVHYIGVNWPHHIFVNTDFKVIGAD